MAASPDSNFKYPFIREDGIIGFMEQISNEKTPGYIAVGAAITSYARAFTIRAAQSNYYGVDEHGFIYADTDSCHIDLPIECVNGMKIHDKNFCCWSLESEWDLAWYVRQKTYIEHITSSDLPYYDVKCAGMPQASKDSFIKMLEDGEANIEDFNLGLELGGKLLPRRIKGGVILKETTYKMR